MEINEDQTHDWRLQLLYKVNSVVVAAAATAVV